MQDHDVAALGPATQCGGLLAATLPACLAGADARGRVAALATLWPEGAVGHDLELRLDGQGSMLEVSQFWLPDGLAALNLAAGRDPGLSCVADCLDWAAGPGHPHSLWLDWHLAPGQTPGQAPGAAGPALGLAPPGTPAEPGAFFAAALALLGAGPCAPALARALSALPPETHLRQIEVMPPRAAPVVRLVLDTGPPAAARALIAFLCPRNLPALSALFALPGFADAPRLELDLTPEGPGARLSLELPALSRPGPAITGALCGLALRGVAAEDAARAMTAFVTWQRLGTASSFGISHLKASATTAPDGTVTPAEIRAGIGLIALPGQLA